jgi:hypothetical protein
VLDIVPTTLTGNAPGLLPQAPSRPGNRDRQPGPAGQPGRGRGNWAAGWNREAERGAGMED